MVVTRDPPGVCPAPIIVHGEVHEDLRRRPERRLSPPAIAEVASPPSSPVMGRRLRRYAAGYRCGLFIGGRDGNDGSNDHEGMEILCEGHRCSPAGAADADAGVVDGLEPPAIGCLEYLALNVPASAPFAGRNQQMPVSAPARWACGLPPGACTAEDALLAFIDHGTPTWWGARQRALGRLAIPPAASRNNHV